MNLSFVFVIIVTLLTVITAKNKDVSSEESIENILLYKDFRPKKKELAPLPPQGLVMPPAPPVTKQPECIPRMCCSMSCTNSCGQNEIGPENLHQRTSMNSMMNSYNPMRSSNPMNPYSMNQMNSMNSVNPMNAMNPMNRMNPMNQNRMNPLQNPKPAPPPSPINRRIKKKPALPTRRNNEFTKEHIKSLISKDEDIKNILKDLVRVTMKKVDLLELMKKRRAAELNTDSTTLNNEEYYDGMGGALIVSDV